MPGGGHCPGTPELDANGTANLCEQWVFPSAIACFSGSSISGDGSVGRDPQRRAYHRGFDFFHPLMPDPVSPEASTDGPHLARALREQRISIRGARTHNLKNINLDLPDRKSVV